MVFYIRDDITYPRLPTDQNGIPIEVMRPSRRNYGVDASGGSGANTSTVIDALGKTRVVRIVVTGANPVRFAFGGGSPEPTVNATSMYMAVANPPEYFNFEGCTTIVVRGVGGTSSVNVTPME